MQNYSKFCTLLAPFRRLISKRFITKDKRIPKFVFSLLSNQKISRHFARRKKQNIRLNIYVPAKVVLYKQEAEICFNRLVELIRRLEFD